MSKVIKTCYQCPFWEDRRDYWCNKLSGWITDMKKGKDGFPTKCPLKKKVVTKTITYNGRELQ